MSKLQWRMDSKIGPLYLTASENGLEGIFRKKQNLPLAGSLKNSGNAKRILLKAARQLEEYFSGKRKKFDVPLDAEGTPFQKKVWGELRKIPYGKICSYKDIARRIKNPKAVRAIGGANGKNPLCIIIPCHRVIASDGSLGGYSGGLAMKKKLLVLEIKIKRDRQNRPDQLARAFDKAERHAGSR